jgi:hypothetical protein
LSYKRWVPKSKGNLNILANIRVPCQVGLPQSPCGRLRFRHKGEEVHRGQTLACP